jgi:MerR family transcriptional regulator, thiopeptide resistance regulator
MLEKAQVLSPTEAARRLGVSAKALRLYERHGLVRPLRSAKGWRGYGPEEMARLHQVLALRRLGLPLARIAVLIKRPEGSLAGVLKLQEERLARESTRVARALTLVRAARRKLADGEILSIDDLAELTKETTMTGKDDEMKAIFDPIIARHYSADERAKLAGKSYDQAEITRQWDAVIADAKAAMAKGNPASSAALDVARRWKALVEQFTGGDPGLANKAGQVWGEAMADKQTAPKLPITPQLFKFMGQAMGKLKENGE